MKHKLSHTLLAVIMALTLTLSIMAVPVSAATVKTSKVISVTRNPYETYLMPSWPRMSGAYKYVLYTSYEGGAFKKTASILEKNTNKRRNPEYTIKRCEDGYYNFKVYVYNSKGKNIKIYTSKTFLVDWVSTGAYKLSCPYFSDSFLIDYTENAM